MATVSVVIPTIAGREELLQKLLDSLPKNLQKIVVKDENLSLSAKRNKGAAQAKGRYILFVDDDNYLQEGSIEEALRYFDKSVGVVGMVAAYVNSPRRVADGGSKRNYTTGFTEGLFTNQELSKLPQMPYEVSEVANCFIMRRQLWRKLHGFDEINFPIDLDEADLCKRAKNLGYKIMMCPKAICYHKSITYSRIPDFRRPMNAYYMGRNRIIYQRKHSSAFGFFYYLVFWFPVFVGFYCLSLIFRRRCRFIPHFLKGAFDGITNRKENKFQ